MIPGFGILIIFMMLIRHIGACIRENYITNSDRQKAIEKGESTYYTIGGMRDTATGHKISFKDEGYLGWSTTDEVTGKKKYHELEELQRQFAEELDLDKHRSKEEPDLWTGWLNQKRVFIDRATKQLMYMSYAGCMNDMDRSASEKRDTYFYVDFFDRSKIIRKTNKQCRLEEKIPDKKWYTLDELKTYRCFGENCRSKDGEWKPLNYDLRRDY